MRLNVLLAAVVVALGGLAWAPQDAGGSSRNAIEKAHARDQRIEFMHVMKDQSSAVLIIPCLRVLKSLYTNSNLYVHLTLNYTSTSGDAATKIVTTKLSDWQLTAHHPQPLKKWAILDTAMDLSDDPVDLDEPITGTAALVSLGGVPTTIQTWAF
jgi:hypothetical protein